MRQSPHLRPRTHRASGGVCNRQRLEKFACHPSPYPAAQGSAAAESREAFIEQEFHAGRDRLPAQPASGASTRASAFSVVEFWREAGPSLWFAKDEEFDRRFRERLLSTHEAAARGDLDDWLRHGHGRAGADPAARPVSAQRLSRHAAHVCDRREGARGSRGRNRRRSRPGGAEGSAAASSICRSAIRRTPADQERSVALARGAWRAGPVAREAAPRHHPPLRPLSASQSDPRTRDDRGGAALSRRGRLRRVAMLRCRSRMDGRAAA